MKRGPHLLLALLLTAGFSPQARADDTRLFEQKVALLLQQRCVQCHNEQKKRGGLDLTSRAGLLRGGEEGRVVVPGDAAGSRLLRMIGGDRPAMPKNGKRLTGDEIDALREWVAAGAPWPQNRVLVPDRKAPLEETWWSLRPLVRPAVPAVKKAGWVRTPIDAFILAALEARGLGPAPEADRATLIRRLTFDLHGLPPTPEEIDVFVCDPASDAYERLVDHLLASPRYGERWGRHWLDVVHYGDTHGYDKDKRRDHAWPYRDYVIDAFNADKPYARFVQEQLAGDVLWPGDPSIFRATGFVVAGPWDFVGHVELREHTVDKLKTRALDRDDIVSNTISTFQSLTAHCARCHDHKFDPIPQRDYYRLQAVFAGVERGNRPYNDREHAAQIARLSEQYRNTTRRIEALQERLQAVHSPELDRLGEQIARLEKRHAALPPLPAGAPSPSNGYHSGIEPQPDSVKWVQIDLGKATTIEQVRLVPARPTDFADSPGFGFPLRFRIDASDAPDFRTFRTLADRSKADFPSPGATIYSVTLRDVKARYVRVTAQRLWRRTGDYVFALAELQVDSAGKNVARGAAVTALDSIEAGRWSRRYLVDDFDSHQRLPDLARPETAARFRQRVALEAELRTAHAARQKLVDSLADPRLRQELAQARAQLLAIQSQRQMVEQDAALYAVVSRPPRPIAVLHRGDVEKPREAVGPGALTCVPGLDPSFAVWAGEPEGKRRAALAAWITDRRNPLTCRSIVNRVWHYHFGQGIVDTPNDFGRNGSRPTHPELLDWLAVDFRDRGGSFKQLHRLILTSAVYRQASRHNARHARIDGNNRTLWRMNRLRLDAEEVRDSVLAVSGKLDLRMGGPGFELFRFKDDHSPTYDHEALEKIHDPATYRRTVYRFVVRSVPNPFLDCMDCADPNVNTPVRNTTLTALQALALLNDPFMVRQAEYFAERLKQASTDPRRQIELACRLALGRPPTAAECDALVEHARKHGLMHTCRLLFNTNEFLFID
jgi:mono/diheme cytochrome c family protein